jgi:hypothetical protein
MCPLADLVTTFKFYNCKGSIAHPIQGKSSAERKGVQVRFKLLLFYENKYFFYTAKVEAVQMIIDCGEVLNDF